MTDKLYRVKWTNEDASGYFIDKHQQRVAQDLANALNELGTPTVYTVEAVPRTPGRPLGSKNKPGHSAGRPRLHTMLDNLNIFRVVSFKLSDDKKTVRARDGYDNYFELMLNKAEMEEMIRNLQDMCDRMVD